MSPVGADQIPVRRHGFVGDLPSEVSVFELSDLTYPHTGHYSGSEVSNLNISVGNFL